MSNSVAREPWFLKGRRTVVQRALITSLVLSGLSAVAGAVWILGLYWGKFYLDDWADHHAFLAFAGGTAAITVSVFVGIPYARWMGCSVNSTALRVYAFSTLVSGPWLGPESIRHSLLMMNSELAQSVGQGVPYAMELMLLSYLIWLAWGIAFFQPTRIWALSAGWCWLNILLSFSAARTAASAIEVLQVLFVGIAPHLLLAVPLFTFAGAYFALLLVPWGIPLWFPPEKESALSDPLVG